MARTTTKIVSPALKAPFAPYADVQNGWDGVNLTVTDLPDGKRLIEVEGAARDQIGGSSIIANLPANVRPATNQVGARAAVRTNGDLVLVGPLDEGGPTVSFKVSYTL